MKRALFTSRIAIVVLACGMAVAASPHIKGIKLAVENPTGNDWRAANVVVSVAELRKIAWRLYFDKRNAIDIYAKRRPTMQLGMFAAPDYIYHDESPEGRDIFRVGDALGVGDVGALVDGSAARVADATARRWRAIASGPV